MFNHFNQNVTPAQSKISDNYLLFIINNIQLFSDCCILNDVFHLCLHAKVKQAGFRNTKTMTFCSEFIAELFTKVFQASNLF